MDLTLFVRKTNMRQIICPYSKAHKCETNMIYLTRTNVRQIRFEYDSMFELGQIYSKTGR